MEWSNLVNPNCKLFLFKLKCQTDKLIVHAHWLIITHHWSIQPGVKMRHGLTRSNSICTEKLKHQLELLFEHICSFRKQWGIRNRRRNANHSQFFFEMSTFCTHTSQLFPILLFAYSKSFYSNTVRRYGKNNSGFKWPQIRHGLFSFSTTCS